MTRLLITGATGFLGRACVAAASGRGFEVHAAARNSPGSLGMPFHPVNLFNQGEVSRLLTALRPTHLLHLAWVATPGTYWTSPENHTWVAASQHLAREFARHGGRRAVFAGTCAEYDWSAAGLCREFETPVRPSTTYGKCKNELREWTEAFSAASDIGIAWARLFFLYGPREHPARLIPSVARALLAGQPAECTSGIQERDFIYVSDAADALVSVLDSQATGPVNIGSGRACPVREVIERVAALCGRPELVRFGARPLPASEPPILVADLSRLREELGWKPKVTLEDGIPSAVDWWRQARQAA